MSFRFLNFDVYHDAKEFAKIIRNLVKRFPASERFVLGDQLRRSSLSVVLNIAEGADRGSDKDFSRYLIHAIGSLNETVAGIDLAGDLGYIPSSQREAAISAADHLSKRLATFRSKLRP